MHEMWTANKIQYFALCNVYFISCLHWDSFYDTRSHKIKRIINTSASQKLSQIHIYSGNYMNGKSQLSHMQS